MTFVNALIARFSQDEEGQGLAEYALILALIAIVAIVALIFLGGQISDILHSVGPRSSAGHCIAGRRPQGRRRRRHWGAGHRSGGTIVRLRIGLPGVVLTTRSAQAPGQQAQIRHGGR